jgi:hypothetical protein
LEGTALRERARKAAQCWLTESRAQADGRRDEALRRIGENIVDEPIPEKLRQVLYGIRQVLYGKRREAKLKPKRRK